jgi:hypothetical protein
MNSIFELAPLLLLWDDGTNVGGMTRRASDPAPYFNFFGHVLEFMIIHCLHPTIASLAFLTVTTHYHITHYTSLLSALLFPNFNSQRAGEAADKVQQSHAFPVDPRPKSSSAKSIFVFALGNLLDWIISTSNGILSRGWNDIF